MARLLPLPETCRRFSIISKETRRHNAPLRWEQWRRPVSGKRKARFCTGAQASRRKRTPPRLRPHLRWQALAGSAAAAVQTRGSGYAHGHSGCGRDDDFGADKSPPGVWHAEVVPRSPGSCGFEPSPTQLPGEGSSLFREGLRTLARARGRAFCQCAACRKAERSRGSVVGESTTAKVVKRRFPVARSAGRHDSRQPPP